MNEIFILLIGIIVLILGFPIGNFLRNQTKEEIKDRQIWFKILVFVGLIGGIIGLLIGNDTLLFTMFFIAIVTSRSIKNERRQIQKKVKS